MKSRLILTAVLLASSAGFAADHTEAPLARADSVADLNDLYTFMNPNNPGELVLISTFSPAANPNTQFSDAVEYRMHLVNVGNNQQHEVLCTFTTNAKINCSGPGGSSVSGLVGTTASNDGMRVYAGLAEDPFFFDGGAFGQTVATLAPQFQDPGTDSFAELNTLAIAIGLDANLVNNNGTDPVIKVYASTNRVSGAGLNGSASGHIFNVDQAGHGIYLEVIDSPDGPRADGGWFVIDDNGNPVWFVGSGPIDGNTATLAVFRAEGTMFPPLFNSDDVLLTESGTLSVTANSCNEFGVDFASNEEQLFNSVSFEVSRLTEIQGYPCQIFTGGQIDRVGRPAVNTALINLLADNGLKDQYNQAEDPASWSGLFAGEMQSNLEALDTLDGVVGNGLLDPATLASVLVDDFLYIDTSIAACDAYLAVELGIADQCGGRTLARDVIDDTLGAVVGPGVSDFVGFTAGVRMEFPFIGSPK